VYLVVDSAQTLRGSCSIDDDLREMLDLREDLVDGVNQTDSTF